MSVGLKKFEECIEKVTYGNKIQRTEYLDNGKFPVVSQESKLINGFWNNEEDLFDVKQPVIVFGDHTRILKFIDFSFVLGADGTKIIKPKSFIDSKFFYYFLEANPVQSKGYSRHYRFLKELKINVPPIATQQKIVAKLDAIFAEIDTATAAAEANANNAEALYQSYLTKVFDTNENSKLHKLDDVVTRLTNGYVGATKNIYLDSGVPYLLARHVKSNVLTFDNRTFISQEFNTKNKKSILKKDDVLLVQSGHIGHSAVVPEEHVGHNCHAMIVITTVKEVLSGDFLSLYFQSNKMKNLFEDMRTGSTIKHLNCGDVKLLMIPIPDLDIQIKIIDEAKKIQKNVELIRSNMLSKVNQLKILKQSILQKAFSGELVKD